MNNPENAGGSPLYEAGLLRNGHLSIRKVLRHALNLLRHNAGAILVVMFAPVILLAAARELSLVVFGGFSIMEVVAQTLVHAGVFLLLWIGFASVLHGQFLGTVTKGRAWRVVIWSRAQVSFAFGGLRLIGVLILLGFATIFLSFIPFGGLVGTLIAAFVWSRLAMVFPAAAVGRPLALEDSWGLTGAAKTRVALLIGSLYLIGQILIALTVSWQSLAGLNPDQETWPTSLVISAVLFSWSAVVAAVLSATYRGLVEMRPPDVRDTYIPQDGSHLADVF